MTALDEAHRQVGRLARAAGGQMSFAIIVFLIAAALVAMLALVGERNDWIAPPALHVLFAEVILSPQRSSLANGGQKAVRQMWISLLQTVFTTSAKSSTISPPSF